MIETQDFGFQHTLFTGMARLCVSLLLIWSAESATPDSSSFSVAMLEQTLSEEERELFLSWADIPDATVAPSTASPSSLSGMTRQSQIEIALLERLSQRPITPASDLLALINERVPGHTETPDSVREKRLELLAFALVPQWFHEALLHWPLPVSPPSVALLAFILSVVPPHAPAYLRSPARIATLIEEWNDVCLQPTLRWTPAEPIPCFTRIVMVNNQPSAWMSLTATTVQQHLTRKLQIARMKQS
jgi:hypothetical protein